MSQNDYYPKYLKYKMKYLHQKKMQIGGREYDLTIIYGSKKPPSIVRVDSEMTMANLILRIPNYEYHATKILFDFTGRVRIDIPPEKKISTYTGTKIMVKYEYEISIKIEEDVYHRILVLNTDYIKKIYDDINKNYTVRDANKKIVINFNNVDIDISDSRSLEDIGIIPGCGRVPECNITLKFVDK